MNSENSGAVLIDNTTIHGAIAAYSEWPPSPNSWTSNPYAVNLRGLMDIIEAMVLFDEIKIDGACGSLAEPTADEGEYDPGRSWDPFQRLEDPGSGKFIFNMDYFSAREYVIGAGILATAAERLQNHIMDGLIQRQADLFKTNQIELAIPRFYTGPTQFMTLISQSFEPEAISSIENELRTLEVMLSNQPHDVANFAMFAFRGFYYAELAHLLSISYNPHSFRSGILAQDDQTGRATFARLALGTIQDLRRDYIEELGPQISAQLNAEFAGPSLRIDLPLIASYIAGHASRRSELIPIALEVRNSSSAHRFRQWVSKVQSAIDEQARLQIVREARQELGELSSDLRREMRLTRAPSTQVTLKLAVPTGVIGADIPVTIRAGLPGWLERVLHRRPHLRFLRDLALSGIEFAPFERTYRTLQA
jgi:hypothetical protein